MENLELILTLAGTAFSLLITCVVFIIRLIKIWRDKKSFLDDMMLQEAITPLMELAEKYLNYSGNEKKEFVLTKINRFALENKIKFNPEVISNKIERLIELSKQVNARQNKEN